MRRRLIQTENDYIIVVIIFGYWCFFMVAQTRQIVPMIVAIVGDSIRQPQPTMSTMTREMSTMTMRRPRMTNDRWP